MTIRTAPPLPECRVCGTPTRRDTWNASGGLCSACKSAAGHPSQLELDDAPPPANVVPIRRPKGLR